MWIESSINITSRYVTHNYGETASKNYVMVFSVGILSSPQNTPNRAISMLVPRLLVCSRIGPVTSAE